MKDLLGLEHQLQYIDYTRANLIHADMSPEDFAKSMQDRGESMGAMLLRIMAASMARQATEASQAKSSDADFLMALFDRNRGLRLKRLIAGQFADLDTVMAGLNGPDGSTLVTERNKVALGKLEKQWSQGHFLRSWPFARHGPATGRRLQPARNGAALANGLESCRCPGGGRRGPNCRARRRCQIVS
jgi:hypothetical protein